MTYRVGVVVRTKNRPDFLVRALADIAAQTYRDFDVVVVNDGGDRADVDGVVAASLCGDRVTVIDSVAPGGRCAAANAGIDAAGTEFVVLHDDDDRWHCEFLARTVQYLDEHPGDAGVVAATEIVYERAVGDRWVEYDRAPFWADMSAVTFTSLLEVNRAVPISFLYRRVVHAEIGGYDESLETVEDWEFYLRLSARFGVGYLPGLPLAYWTQRPGARGIAGNSMFELAGAHERDDLAVRDRELRAWVANNGAGLPLYIALVEKRIRDDITREISALLERQRIEIVDDIYARHPLWRRVRRLRDRVIPNRGDGPSSA